MTPFVTVALVVLVVAVLASWFVGRRTGPPAAPIPIDQLDAAARQPIEESLARGEVVRAIKQYREAVPTSLVDAKNTVEAHAQQRGW